MIADELEENIENIIQIYNVASAFAPEYDIDQIYNTLYKKEVAVDTSAITSQIQSSIGQVTANMQPAKIPVEADTKGIMGYISDFNALSSAISNISIAKGVVAKSLD